MAHSNEFGPATSHMVLAAEEAIKALVLAMASDGVKFPQRAVRSILTKHQPRHFAAALMALGQFFLTEWTGLITSLNRQHLDTTTPEYASARKSEVADLVTHLNELADASPGEARIIDILEWWNRSDTTKQRGFYVDFEGGAWLAPSSIVESDYLEAHSIAHDLVTNFAQAIPIALSEPEESKKDFVRSLNKELQSMTARRLNKD